jgi:hypothetical protein
MVTCAVGQHGTILCKEKSGRWARVASPTRETLRSGAGLALGIGDLHDYIVGDNGTVLRR